MIVKFKRINKLILLMLVLFFAVNLAVFSESDEQVFSLSYPVDIPVLVTGLGLFITDLLLEPVKGPMQPMDNLLAVDRLAVFEQNGALDLTSDILFYSSLSLPVLLIIEADWWSAIETTTIFAETMLMAIASKDIIKDFCPRWRPYSYFDIPEGDDDYMNSFPSGHTTTVFAVCSFASYSYAKMYPDSKWKIPLFAGAYTLATTTAVFRVVSGNHFITDIIAGALLGSIIGIGIPLLHQIKTDFPIQPMFRVELSDEPSFTMAFNLGE